ncbi:hypothetical protein DPMN_099346 [Dreissena polymorpha]|uniref:Uncharacterized protein n=1 Tax=Dreissena polymorpha TaxID=45954 RepID=A0A9D4LGA1_DREPO|nr:hypothetical protein DPMN_099346 [Dreissena polymorpha]
MNTIFKRIQDIIMTNLLTKFHEDRKINAASRVLTRKNATLPGGHVFQPTGIIFELFQDIIWMNLLTKKNAPPLGSYVFQAKVTIFKLIQDIIGTNLLSKKCPAPWRPFFQPSGIVFELIQDIIETNLLTKFHEEWTINLASRDKCPAPGGHVFKATKAIFELIQDIVGTNLLTKVLTRKNAPPPWWPYIIKVASRVQNAPPLDSHVFQANITIFELIQVINKTNLLTICHEDLTINVSSRVLTRKNAPPPGGHIFQPKGIIFFNLTINVASRVLTRFYYSHI